MSANANSDVNIFNQEKIGINLNDVNLITINPVLNNKNYNQNYINHINQEYHFYNTLWNFNEDIIPLLTSLFEKHPQLFYTKTYTCIQNKIIIRTVPWKYVNKSYLPFCNLNIVSFQTDIQNNYKIYEKKITYNQKILKSILDSNPFDNDKILLSRIYKLNPPKIELMDFVNDIMYEEITNNIIWEWEWGTFEIIIYDDVNTNTGNMCKNYDKLKKCKYQFNINIIEDNNLITARMKHINNLINIFNKIKI